MRTQRNQLHGFCLLWKREQQVQSAIWHDCTTKLMKNLPALQLLCILEWVNNCSDADWHARHQTFTQWEFKPGTTTNSISSTASGMSSATTENEVRFHRVGCFWFWTILTLVCQPLWNAFAMHIWNQQVESDISHVWGSESVSSSSQCLEKLTLSEKKQNVLTFLLPKIMWMSSQNVDAIFAEPLTCKLFCVCVLVILFSIFPCFECFLETEKTQMKMTLWMCNEADFPLKTSFAQGNSMQNNLVHSKSRCQSVFLIAHWDCIRKWLFVEDFGRLLAKVLRKVPKFTHDCWSPFFNETQWHFQFNDLQWMLFFLLWLHEISTFWFLTNHILNLCPIRTCQSGTMIQNSSALLFSPMNQNLLATKCKSFLHALQQKCRSSGWETKMWGDVISNLSLKCGILCMCTKQVFVCLTPGNSSLHLKFDLQNGEVFDVGLHLGNPQALFVMLQTTVKQPQTQILPQKHGNRIKMCLRVKSHFFLCYWNCFRQEILCFAHFSCIEASIIPANCVLSQFSEDWIQSSFVWPQKVFMFVFHAEKTSKWKETPDMESKMFLTMAKKSIQVSLKPFPQKPEASHILLIDVGGTCSQ